MKQLTRIADALDYRPAADRRLFSATHEEIQAGLTTDVYFLKTREIVERSGHGRTMVTAEVFARKSGVLAGVTEALGLLQDLDITVWAQPEGSRFSPEDVVMRLEGRYAEFGIYETAVLGMLASSSGWASAAALAKEAAGDKPVFSFGARHLHPAVAPVMERAAIIGGVDGAACILGAKLAGEEPVGTVPHALFLVMGDTVTGAEHYDQMMPPESPRTILVDTFCDEVEESLRLAERFGPKLEAVRLDTPSERGGVTAGLVRELRAKLDLAGYTHVKIFVSGGLDPERIRLLMEAGADAFGVGSFISSASPIDMTLDLKAVAGRPLAKRGRLPGVTASEKLVQVQERKPAPSQS